MKKALHEKRFTMTTKIGVVGVKDAWSSLHLAQTIKKATGFSLLMDMEKISFDSGKKTLLFDDGRQTTDLRELDAIIIKKIARPYEATLAPRLDLLGFLEHSGVRFFPSPHRISACYNRLANTVMLQQAGLPMPPTCITESVDVAAKAIRGYEVAVCKPLYATKAEGMILLSADDPELVPKLETFRESNPIMYLQKKIDLPGYDLAVTFLGADYLGTYARVASGEAWDTTTRSGGSYAAYDPPEEVIRLAGKAREAFGLDFTSVDVALTREGPMLFEVSAFGGFRGLREAKDIDVADLYVTYVRKKLEK